MEEKKKSESLKEYHKEYYKRNREKIIKRATEYNKTHRDRVRETSRKYEMRRVEKLTQLEEENKKLKSDLHFERNMLDNVRAEYESLQNVIKELKEELKYYKEKSEFLNKVIVKYQEEN